ncbi:MAG: ribonuclease P protein component [Verrucomicrobia bacterium]|nr:ribonuclease P protein component [Verrucomicrobiota bacterium]
MIRPGRIRFKFCRSSRLSRASDFRSVKVSGKSWNGKHLVLAILARETEAASRIGIVTTKRLGNAVTRNKIRRRIREIFRLNQHRIQTGILLVTIARVSSATATFDELRRDWLRLVERASILAPGPHGSPPPDPT